jgi:hypothetical protein
MNLLGLLSGITTLSLGLWSRNLPLLSSDPGEERGVLLLGEETEEEGMERECEDCWRCGLDKCGLER